MGPRGQGPRGGVKGAEVKTIEPWNPRTLDPFICVK